MPRSDLSKRLLKPYRDLALGLLVVAVGSVGYYGFKHGFEALPGSDFQTKAIFFSTSFGLFFGPILLMPLIVENLKARGFDLATLSDEYLGPKENWKVRTQKYFLSTVLVFVFIMLGSVAATLFLNDGSLSDFGLLIIAPAYLVMKLVTYPLVVFFPQSRKIKNPYKIGIPRHRLNEKSSPVETGED
jgi:hypothetical protein